MNHLKNKTIVLTRSLEQSKDLVKLLGDEQINFIIAPVIKIIPLSMTDELKQIFENINQFDFILFTSSNAVRYFFYFLLNLYQKIHSINRPKFACIGEKTAKTLQTYGFKADFIGQTRTGKEFLEAFLDHYGNIKKSKIFLPVSELANIEKYELLKKTGWEVIVQPIYKTVKNSLISQEVIQQIKERQDLILTFFSPSTFAYFTELIPVEEFHPKWIIAAIGETTKQFIEKHGIPVHIVPEKSTSEDLIKAIKQYWNKESI